MSASTISFKSLAESIRSFVTHAIIPHPALVVDLEFEPFEDPISPVASDSDSVEPSYNSKLFSDRVSPAVFAASNPDDEPLGSPDNADYYGGYEFYEDDPSEDDPINALSGIDESSSAQAALVIALEDPRKTIRPQSTLPPSTLALIVDWAAASPVPSPPPSPLSPLPSPLPSPGRSGPSRRRPRTSPSSSVGPPPKRC
ncbi:hypothetical protein Tco_0900097 [Tanacetum coccineum]